MIKNTNLAGNNNLKDMTRKAMLVVRCGGFSIFIETTTTLMLPSLILSFQRKRERNRDRGCIFSGRYYITTYKKYIVCSYCGGGASLSFSH